MKSKLRKGALSFFLPLLAVLTFSLALPKLSLAAPPPDFTSETLITNLNEPTGIAFTPDGRMLIIERAGRIRVVQPGQSVPDPTPFLQLTNINIQDGERGLVGLAIDPNFFTNGYYYVFYTANSPLRNRVSRFTAVGNSTNPSSEAVIWQDSEPAPLWHHGGTVAFGPDGLLYISTGDGFDSNFGSSHVSQVLTSFWGKILRINPDGSVPPDNPFYDGAGPNRDAIWARGLRNPFRFSFDFDMNRMYIADVGGNDVSSSVEEINIGVPGANYGWPICEGNCAVSGMTNPYFFYSHAGSDASVTGGFVYRGGNFPAEFQGDYFYGDYVRNWIRGLNINPDGSLAGTFFFEPYDGAENGPYGEVVDLKQGPDGALYYVDIGITWEGRTNPGTVRRVKYTGANQPPVITQASADVASGPGPTLSVNFSSTAFDPENQPLSYSWNFGDGSSSTNPNPNHVYQAKGPYVARLTVSDGVNQTISDPINITVGIPPQVTIMSPINNSTFRAGDNILYFAEATDADGVLSDSNYQWRINFIHLSHTHPESLPSPGPSGSFTVPTTGHEIDSTTHYQFTVTVTDSDNLQTTVGVEIFPEIVYLTFDTVPSGLALSLDQENGLATPFVRSRAVNFQSVVDAPLFQSGYSFVSWSDAGAANHVITTPEQNMTYIATYTLVSTPTPSPTPTPLPPTPTPALIGLIAGFSLNETSGTTAFDSSPNAFDATLFGGPGWSASGRYGGGLVFDGTDDRARTSSSLSLPAQFTMMGWVNNPSNQPYETVITIGQSRDMYLENGVLSFYDGVMDRSFGPEIGAGWRHVAIVSTGSQLMAFVDGQPRGSPVSVSLPAASGVLQMGSWINGSQNVDFFSGTLDEVRVYNRALTQAEIQSAMNSQLVSGPTPTPTPLPPTLTPTPVLPTPTPTPLPPTPTPTPVLPTPTPTPLPPTPTPTPVLPTPTPTPLPTTRRSLSFDGVNDLVQGVNIPLSTQFTYEAWVKRGLDNNSYQTFMSDATSGYTQSMVTMYIDGGGSDCPGLSDQFAYYQSSANLIFCSGVSAAVGTWYHVAVSRDLAGNLRYFVNGVLTATRTGAPAPTDSSGRFNLGRAGSYAGEYYAGILDEIRVSNIARYTQNFTPQLTPFVADSNTVVLYHLDNGSGQTVTDSSGNSRHGVLGTSTSVQTSDPVWSTDVAIP